LDQHSAVGTTGASVPSVRPSAGSRVRSREVAGFVVTEAAYRASARVPRHSHELAGLAVVMDGGYVKRIQQADHDCRPGTLTLEPAGVSHAESYGRADVRALLIEILPWRLPAIADHESGLAVPLCTTHSAVRALGRRACRELWAPDLASPLVLESIALELIAVASRSVWRHRVPPSWLRQVTERLRDDFRSDIGLRALAAGAGVHPAHLARAFREYEGCTVGEYVRRRRIEWAAEQLERTTEPLVSIAHAAGFYDQSHFSRVFVREIGDTPARYRAHARTRAGEKSRATDQ
jgi:AraC family transcriptional regulator